MTIKLFVILSLLAIAQALLLTKESHVEFELFLLYGVSAGTVTSYYIEDRAWANYMKLSSLHALIYGGMLSALIMGLSHDHLAGAEGVLLTFLPLSFVLYLVGSLTAKIAEIISR